MYIIKIYAKSRVIIVLYIRTKIGRFPKQSIKITTILYPVLLSRHFLKSTIICYYSRSGTKS
jgi:hypothetical protein